MESKYRELYATSRKKINKLEKEINNIKFQLRENAKSEEEKNYEAYLNWGQGNSYPPVDVELIPNVEVWKKMGLSPQTIDSMKKALSKRNKQAK